MPAISPITPVLLAGGAGTRLWPVSRDALPKQFLPLVGERSTYQETLLRVHDPMFAAPIVITGPNFHFFAKRQAEEIGIDVTVVIEPLRRDSGPAIAAATAIARTEGRGFRWRAWRCLLALLTASRMEANRPDHQKIM